MDLPKRLFLSALYRFFISLLSLTALYLQLLSMEGSGDTTVSLLSSCVVQRTEVKRKGVERGGMDLDRGFGLDVGLTFLLLGLLLHLRLDCLDLCFLSEDCWLWLLLLAAAAAAAVFDFLCLVPDDGLAVDLRCRDDLTAVPNPVFLVPLDDAGFSRLLLLPVALLLP